MKNIFLTIVLSLSSLGLFSQSLEFISHSTSNNVNEGDTVYFWIQATDIDVGTTIYYELVGDITPDDLTAGNQYTNLDTDSLTGSFTIRNVASGNLHPTLGGGRFPGGGPGQVLAFNFIEDLTTEGTEDFVISLFSDEDRTNAYVVSSGTTVGDTSITDENSNNYILNIYSSTDMDSWTLINSENIQSSDDILYLKTELIESE